MSDNGMMWGHLTEIFRYVRQVALVLEPRTLRYDQLEIPTNSS